MAAAALIVLSLAGIFKYVMAGLMVRGGASPTEMRTQDAILTGLFCAIIVTIALGTERFRREQFRERVKAVSDLNHHLRNALEVIMHGHLLPESTQTAAILESVERIDHALQKIVPEERHWPALYVTKQSRHAVAQPQREKAS
jgi:hypothetical protein